jgi:hypothetical protein
MQRDVTSLLHISSNLTAAARVLSQVSLWNYWHWDRFICGTAVFSCEFSFHQMPNLFCLLFGDGEMGHLRLAYQRTQSHPSLGKIK